MRGMYANDFVLVADSGAELQAMLDVVEAYVSRWKMKFNTRKSKVMVMGKKVEVFKYLGVWVDRKL